MTTPPDDGRPPPGLRLDLQIVAVPVLDEADLQLLQDRLLAAIRSNSQLLTEARRILRLVQAAAVKHGGRPLAAAPPSPPLQLVPPGARQARRRRR